jgi:hypothetical protein
MLRGLDKVVWTRLHVAHPAKLACLRRIMHARMSDRPHRIIVLAKISRKGSGSHAKLACLACLPGAVSFFVQTSKLSGGTFLEMLRPSAALCCAALRRVAPCCASRDEASFFAAIWALSVAQLGAPLSQAGRPEKVTGSMCDCGSIAAAHGTASTPPMQLVFLLDLGSELSPTFALAAPIV